LIFLILFPHREQISLHGSDTVALLLMLLEVVWGFMLANGVSAHGPVSDTVATSIIGGGSLDVASINHVAVVVDDFDTSARAYSKLFGVNVSGQLSTDHWVWYRGNYTTSRPTLAFIGMGADSSFRLEIIQASTTLPSFWNELREHNGPMFHHTGINVPDMDAAQYALESLGCPLRQMGQGDW
jgi:catechol 2,3-dioxygenase-like lactoylglutathione lyase family enzyme